MDCENCGKEISSEREIKKSCSVECSFEDFMNVVEGENSASTENEAESHSSNNRHK